MACTISSTVKNRPKNNSCRARFEVLPTGRVQGTVRAPVLVVHEGAEINGSVHMTDPGGERQEPTSLVHRREAMGSS